MPSRVQQSPEGPSRTAVEEQFVRVNQFCDYLLCTIVAVKIEYFIFIFTFWDYIHINMCIYVYLGTYVCTYVCMYICTLWYIRLQRLVKIAEEIFFTKTYACIFWSVSFIFKIFFYKYRFPFFPLYLNFFKNSESVNKFYFHCKSP